ncbi:MAG: GNAT family N-acetyltransferase [Bacteroidetes bacterium]|nr:GNAT family N-acetyltransferase [Bacteroidota bacterium]
MEERFGMADDAVERWHNDFPQWLRDETRRIVVAEEEGAVVGFVTAQRWAPPPIYTFSEEVYLNELYVDPAYRRRGIGQALVAAIRSWSEDLGAERLRLGVLAENEAGRAFWAAQGGTVLSQTLTIPLDPEPSSTTPPEKRRIGF